MSNYQNIASLNHVIKTFGDVVAVSDASFSVEKGKIVGFLGPNGSGKTTCIRLILGLIKPQQGDVSLFGVNPFNHAAVKYLVGYIPEQNAFPTWITARKYLNYLARFYMSSSEATNRTNDVLEAVDLADVADKRIRQFSKGMKQRMKIGQALLHRPALVIGDEPFNGLDPVVRREMFDIIRGYQKDYEMTFLISSHILFEVDRLANKIVLLYKGRTIAQGTPKRIREMIQDQPHEIQITSHESKEISKQLIQHSDASVISSVGFSKGLSGVSSITVNTLNPRSFYSLLTDIIAENNLSIQEVRAVDEGLENLF
ncbi:MAG: ABC transporter ATP-binding protein, partial [Candidatus Kariarchaeaceae archaeon]